MKRRHPAGSVLSIVFGVTFTLIVMGVGLFFISKILGGSRELNNAADAGVLNVAKAAITSPFVNVYKPLDPGLPLAAEDFFALADQPGSNGATCSISMLTYNRAVAQALLVASNAQVEGTPAALGNANLEVLAAKAVGTSLQNSFNTPATATVLNTAFSNIRNNLKMMGEGQQSVVINPDGVTRVQSAFMKTGGSANVFFDPAVFSVAIPNANPFTTYQIPLNDKDRSIKPRKLPDGNYASAFYEVPGAGFPSPALYLAGYQPIPVLQGTAFANSLFAVPNEPQVSPHLVSRGDFDNAVGLAPDPSVPENAFMIDCHAFDKTTKGPVETTACAMVGCTDSTFPIPVNSGLSGSGANGTDYVAAIPAGFIRIVNLPDMNTVSAVQSLGLAPTPNALYDGLHYIFNTKETGNHLASDGGGGAYVTKQLVYTTAPKSGFFVTLKDGGKGVLTKFAAYVDSSGTDGLGKDESLDPIRNTLPPHQGITPLLYAQNPNAPPAGYLIHTGTGSGQLATLQQILYSPGLRSNQSFFLNSATVDNAPLWVTEQMDAMLDNFGSSIEKVVNASNYPTISEYLKALVQEKLYDAVNQKSFHFSFTLTKQFISKGTTGLKMFKHYDKAGQLIRYASPNWWHGAPSASPTYPLFGNESDNKPSTPMELLNEINATAHKSNKPNLNQQQYKDFIQVLTQRCQQMSPSITSTDVVNALNTAPLGMGNSPQTLYLHLDLNSPTPTLVLTKNLLDNQGKPYDTQIPADGYDPSNPSIVYPTYTAEYSINGNVVDTQKDGSPTALQADMNLEDRPYQNVSAVNAKGKKVNPSTALTAIDGAVFHPSSGYNNLLGELQFFQTPGNPPNTPITMTWSQPN